MKQLVVCAVGAICISSPSSSGELDYYCEYLGFNAGFIMDFRQEDTVMSLVVHMLGNDGKDQHAIDMIIRAYELPLLDTDANKIAAVSAFRNQVELECFQMIAEPGAEVIVQQAIEDAQS